MPRLDLSGRLVPSEGTLNDKRETGHAKGTRLPTGRAERKRSLLSQTEMAHRVNGALFDTTGEGVEVERGGGGKNGERRKQMATC